MNFVTGYAVGSYIPVVPENFGRFLNGLMEDLGVRPPELASLVKRDQRTITNWLNAQAAPGGSLTLVADAFDIPLIDLRRAVKGEATLPAKYRDRRRWKASRAAEARGLTQVMFDLAPYDYEVLEDYARPLGLDVPDAARSLMLEALRAHTTPDTAAKGRQITPSKRTG